MKMRSVCLVAALAGTAIASAAQAEEPANRWSVELFAGANAALPGEFLAERTETSTQGPVTFGRVGFNQAYQNRYTGGAELAYSFDSHLAAFARAGYSSFNGDSHRIGMLFSDTTGASPVNADFADTNTRSFDLGARYMFASADASLRPFIGLSLGDAKLSAVRANVDNVDTGGTTEVTLGRASDVFEQRLETGLQYSPTPRLDLRLTAAATHVDSQRSSTDPNLALVGLTAERRDVPGHWDYPAELGAVWHF